MPDENQDSPIESYTLDELREHLREVEGRLTEYHTTYAGRAFPESVQAEYDKDKDERAQTRKLIAHLEERESFVREMGQTDGRVEDGEHAPAPAVRTSSDPWNLSEIRTNIMDPEKTARELNTRARRALDAIDIPNERVDEDAAKRHVEKLLAKDDKRGTFARYMLVTSSPLYARAFGKALNGQPLSRDEQRALSLSDSSGGYAVPFALDPTIIPSSDGSVNPLRAIANVKTIVGESWKGVTSAGVTVTRSGEADPINPTTPTLAQPVITPTAVKAEVQGSIEVFANWQGAQGEIAQMFAEAKDDEEADSFVQGLGPDTAGHEPGGVVATLPENRHVPSGSASAFGSEDVYALLAALPPRFRSRASFLANFSIYSTIRQFAEDDGPDLWERIGADTPPLLLGKRAYEASTMDGVVTNGAQVLLAGDFNNFGIVDRLGMTVEYDPVVRDGNGKWTGQRAILAHWMNSAGILVDNAFRLLVVETS